MQKLCLLLLMIGSFAVSAGECDSILKYGQDESILSSNTSIKKQAKSLYCMDQRRSQSYELGINLSIITDAIPIEIGGTEKGSEEYRNQVCNMSWDQFSFGETVISKVRRLHEGVVEAWRACSLRRGFNPSYQMREELIAFSLEDHPGGGIPPAKLDRVVVTPSDALVDCDWPPPGLIPGDGSATVTCRRNEKYRHKDVIVEFKSSNVAEKALLILPDRIALATGPIPDIARWAIPTHPIEVPTGGQFGSYRLPVFCPKGSYMVGIQQKIEASQGGGDDTGLNDVNFMCRNPISGELTARTGLGGERWGDWVPAYKSNVPDFNYCAAGELAVALQLRAEDHLGNDDDTGADAIAMYCAAPSGQHSDKIYNPINRIPSDMGQFGSWRQVAVCPNRAAVCGISLNVEAARNNNDDTAANGAMMYCCPF